LEGIPISNKDGTVEYGKSIVAGRKVVIETAIVRAVMPVVNLGMPITAMFLL